MLGTVPLLRPPSPFVCWPFASLRGSSAPSPGSWFLAQGGSGSSAGLLSTGAECHLCWGRWRQHGAGGDWVSASVQGLCPSVMSSSSPGSMGMLWQRWDLGGSVVFLSLPTPWGPTVSPSLPGHPAVLLLIPHEAPHLGGQPGDLVTREWLLWPVEPILCSCHLSHQAVSALANVLQLRQSGSPGVQEGASAGCQSLSPGHSWAHLCFVAWAGLAHPGTTPQA